MCAIRIDNLTRGQLVDYLEASKVGALGVGWSGRPCGTNPINMTSLISRRRSFPPARAVAEVGVTTSVSIEMVWVLPSPLGPRRSKTSPSSTEKETPSAAARPHYFLANPDFRMGGRAGSLERRDRGTGGGRCDSGRGLR